MPSVCLTMMVRNESRVIDRALDSALPHVDAWFVADTGSDDDTPAIVERRLAHLPGRLHRTRFVDFGASRTETVSLAREFCLSHGIDYLLLLDGDELVEVKDPGWKGKLDGTPYLLLYDDPFSYRVTTLIPARVRWRYVGRTHEYIEALDPCPTAEPFDGVVLHDRADGGSKADKFPRDLALLERTLREDPGDVRAWFYLAETLRNGAIDTLRAFEAYTRRAGMGGFEEEAWYAAYRRGTCLEALPGPTGGLWPAIDAYFAAWARRPWRAEPAYEVVRLAAAARLHLLGALLGEIVLRHVVPRPEREQDILFIDRRKHGARLQEWTGVCRWYAGDSARAAELFDLAIAGAEGPDDVERLRKNRSWCDGRPPRADGGEQIEGVLRACPALREHRLHDVNAALLDALEEHDLFRRRATEEHRARVAFERSISLFYLGKVAEAARHTFDVSARRDLPAALRETARHNRVHVVTALPPDLLRAAPLEVDPAAIPVGYRATNPSATRTPDGLRIIVRTVNYRLRADGTYDFPGFVGTRNFLGALDRDAALDLVPIEPAFPPGDDGLVRGFEDLRLVALPRKGGGHRLVALANRAVPGSRGRRMALLDLEEEDSAVRIARAVDLHGVGDDRTQKNWMPAVVEGELFLVYSCDPTIVLRPDLRTGRCRKERTSTPPVACDDLRGGSQLVDVSDLAGEPAWIAFAHGVLSEGPRRYYHALVLFDRRLAVAAVSDPFLLRGEGLEFVAGAARDGEDLVVTWGEDDGEAWVGRMSAATALGLCRV